jgi:cephalosporin hydroxylase
MRDPIKEFEDEVQNNIEQLKEDNDLQAASRLWIRNAGKYKYAYNFKWLGRPIIQFPQDMIALQEIIYTVKPTLIIECGIAHGGSIIYYASLLELLHITEGFDGKVVGIDIDIRSYNRKAIDEHPMSKRIELVQGSSIDPNTINLVKDKVKPEDRVLVILDSNHTHAHVLSELKAYAPLVTLGSYCVVFDTLIEDMPKGSFSDRPWAKGDNPKTAVYEFLKESSNFEIDENLESKLLITVAPSGFLKRVL